MPEEKTLQSSRSFRLYSVRLLLNNKLEWMWRKRRWPNLKYNPGNFIEGPRKALNGSVRGVGLRVEIWTRDSRIAKQECCLLDCTFGNTTIKIW
jgi:hypothetical protein